jgi:hypothetical protein
MRLSCTNVQARLTCTFRQPCIRVMTVWFLVRRDCLSLRGGHSSKGCALASSPDRFYRWAPVSVFVLLAASIALLRACMRYTPVRSTHGAASRQDRKLHVSDGRGLHLTHEVLANQLGVLRSSGGICACTRASRGRVCRGGHGRFENLCSPIAIQVANASSIATCGQWNQWCRSSPHRLALQVSCSAQLLDSLEGGPDFAGGRVHVARPPVIAETPALPSHPGGGTRTLNNQYL